MQTWHGWPLRRIIYLFLFAAFVLVGAQVYLLHGAADFRSPFMWSPVVFAPVLVIAAAVMVFSRSSAAGRFFDTVYYIGGLIGLVGTYFHLSGVIEDAGGLTMEGLMHGPPVFLPFIYAALALFGVLFHRAHAEEGVYDLTAEAHV
jgi:hypothetical protein